MISEHHGDVMYLEHSPGTWRGARKVFATGAVIFVASLLLVALWVRGTYSAHQTVMRAQRARNLKTLYVALVQYTNDYGCLPPAHTANDAGRPLQSWRALLLPYLGHESLYSQINRHEPWDSHSNHRLLRLMPEHYRSPQEARMGGTSTSYFAVLGPHVPCWGIGGRKPWDAAGADAIMLIEWVGSKTPWMEPRDLTLEQVLDILRPESGSSTSGNCSADVCYLTIGGDVRIVDQKADRESLRKRLLGVGGR